MPAATVAPARLARLLPRDVSCVETCGERAHVELLPAEAVAVRDAPVARVAEFATTRACAREAMIMLGVPPVAIARRLAGDPCWPAGVVGSLTHCSGYRAAAVASASSYAGVGIDAEPHARLPRGALDTLAGPAERARLAELPATGTAWDRVLFSAKEAAFKAWFPRTGGSVDARGIVVRLAADGTFTADISGERLAGRWLVGDGLVLAAVAQPS